MDGTSYERPQSRSSHLQSHRRGGEHRRRLSAAFAARRVPRLAIHRGLRRLAEQRARRGVQLLRSRSPFLCRQGGRDTGGDGAGGIIEDGFKCVSCGTIFRRADGHYDEDCPKERASCDSDGMFIQYAAKASRETMADEALDRMSDRLSLANDDGKPEESADATRA